MKKILILILSITIFYSCTKEAGKGGASKINGKIIVEEYSEYNNQHVRTYYAVDENVYIVYGDDDYYSDKIKTDGNGYYEFSGLQRGDYKIYAYTQDEKQDEIPYTVNVSIESNGSVVDASYIRIKDYVSSGTASVTGRLFVYDYNSDLTFLKDTFYGANRYVYFGLKDNETYIDRVKTNPEGYFVFDNLLPGDYEVYAYSKTNASVGEIAIKKYFSLSVDEDIELPRLEIID